jgi:hypothetical protein
LRLSIPVDLAIDQFASTNSFDLCTFAGKVKQNGVEAEEYQL